MQVAEHVRKDATERGVHERGWAGLRKDDTRACVAASQPLELVGLCLDGLERERRVKDVQLVEI